LEDFSSRSIRIYNSRRIFGDPKKEFGGGYNETMKVAELKNRAEE